MRIKYEHYHIAEAYFSFGEDSDIQDVTYDDLDYIEEEGIETFFVLYGQYWSGKDGLMSDVICASPDFHEVAKIYSRITGCDHALNPPNRGYGLELAGDWVFDGPKSQDVDDTDQNDGD